MASVNMADDPGWSMTPEQVTQGLEALTTAHFGVQPSSEKEPTTGVEAAALRAQHMADPQWRNKLESGDGAATRENERLLKLEANRDRIGDAIKGQIVPVEFETVSGKELSGHKLLSSIDHLRGENYDAIERIMKGETVVPEEQGIPNAARIAGAERWLKDKNEDPEWRARVLRKQQPEYGEWKGLTAVISQKA